MTKNEIITQLYNDPEYDLLFSKLAGQYSNLVDELKQELFLILLEKNDELIFKLHRNNEFKWFIIRIFSSMIRSNTSPFYKKFRKEELEKIMEYNILEYNVEDQIIEEDIYKTFDIYQYAIDNNILSWYDQELFNLYYRIHPSFLEEDITKKMTYVTIAEKLNVSKLNILNQINKIKYKLFKELINEEFIVKKHIMQEFITNYETKNKK